MQQPESLQNSDTKRKRRKRTDDQGRNFTCGKCGKSYLSYPALYTHIKTKHSDEPLSKLARSYESLDSPMNQAERAERSHTSREKEQIQREKQRERQKERQREKQREKQLEDNLPLYGNSLPEVNNIEVLREFLFKYFPNIVVHPSHRDKAEMSLIDRREFKEMREYWSNGRRREDESFSEFYETPIKFVLGRFLNELESEVQNFSFKKFLIFFAYAFKKALQKIKQDENYFRANHAGELPLLFDQILREHLLLDSNDFVSNPTLATRMLYHFGRWMFVNKFTNFSLKYNF